jgi:hypothetical protein
MKIMMSLKHQKTFKRFIGSRVLGLLFIIAAPLALGINTGGAQVVPEIDNALNCGRLGEVRDIAPGNDLFRVDVDLNNFPNAICNDGSGAVFYVRQASNNGHRSFG